MRTTILSIIAISIMVLALFSAINKWPIEEASEFIRTNVPLALGLYLIISVLIEALLSTRRSWDGDTRTIHPMDLLAAAIYGIVMTGLILITGCVISKYLIAY